MRTGIPTSIKNTPAGQEADAILRSCVHCGFCNAACPTYQLLGDERDGPRGRIYSIKSFLEGENRGTYTQFHLDRCLHCRACETACPSGVRYGRLADIARDLLEKEPFQRERVSRWVRLLLRAIVPYPSRFALCLSGAWLIRPFLSKALQKKIPDLQRQFFTRLLAYPHHPRKMLILDGCVQSVVAPSIHRATAHVLDQLGIQLIHAKNSGCCGAVSYHLAAHEEGQNFMRRNIDAWWPYVEQGIEAIVTTASGCGVTLKEYGVMLQHDPYYAEKAKRIADLSRDISEILVKEKKVSIVPTTPRKIAFHSPCTLQHGQQLGGVVEKLLKEYGYELTLVSNATVCCGSAGTYSVLQPALSEKLLINKIASLEAGHPHMIVTANIGCLLHLRAEARVPVHHWIELFSPIVITQ